MTSWIFVINDTNKEFKKRMRDERWPIFVHTQNRKNLQIGDNVIFYEAGLGGQKFLGTSSINSEVKKTTRLDYFVELNNINVWKKNVKVKDLLNKLDFIKDKQVWGRFLQGGVRRISEKDFDIITKGNE